MSRTTLDVGLPQVDVSSLASQFQANASTVRTKGQFDSLAIDMQTAVTAFRAAAQLRGLPQYKTEQVVLLVGQLLTARSCKVRYEDKVILAMQMLVHAGDPSTITSRGFNTSFAAACEYLFYRDCPELLVAMLCETLLTGQCSSPTGRTVRIARENRLPINGCDKSLQPPASRRSYASQIAQSIVVSDMVRNIDGNLTYLVTRVNADTTLVGMTSGHLLYCEEARPTESDPVIEAVFCNDVCIGRLGDLSPRVLAAQLQAAIPDSSLLTKGCSISGLFEQMLAATSPMVACLKIADEISAHVVLGVGAGNGVVSLWHSTRGFHAMGLNEFFDSMI